MPMMMAVTFTRAGRLYYLDAGDVRAKVGDKVLFPTSTSPEVAEVVWGPEWVADDVGGLPVCAGVATADEERRDEANKKKRAEIQVAAQKLIRSSKLPMKISGVDWADVGHESGRATATVYFTAPTRVDFRQLVRDLAQTIDAKVVLTQLSARDDARVQGGIGSCGRDTCCSTFLVDFEPVTVRMARDQDLPANPMKISGACGRLMCCLKYEHPIYDEFRAGAPPVGSRVETPDGDGKVVAHDVPRDAVVVRLEAGGRATVCDRASVCASRKAYDSR
ncbi:MAG: stage 0 sporulation family protein [Candidatus Nanopelagicales bacterium]